MKTRILILKICFIALFSALIFVSAAFLAIPYAGGTGYFNLSDALILFASAYLGPEIGIISGIIGSSLSDLYAGFANCIPFTILAKSLEAIVFSLIFFIFRKRKYIKHISFFIAPLFMVASYIPYYLLYDNGQGVLALISSCYDLLQGTLGAIIALSLYLVFIKIKLPYISSNILNKRWNSALILFFASIIFNQ